MLIVIGQTVVSCLMLGVGLLALYAGSQTPGQREPHRSAWILSGLTFGCVGFLATVQALLATRAFVAGPGSALWVDYVRWAPAWNHSRGLMVVAFGAGLALLSLVKDTRVRTALMASAIMLLVALVIGAAIGWAEGPLVPRIHLIRVSGGNLTQMALLASALLLHLGRDSMDRLLWACLAVYFVQLGLGSLWAVARSWSGVPGTLVPSVHTQLAFSMTAWFVMLMLAVRYAQHQRNSRYVPSLLEHFRPVRLRSIQ